MGWEPGRAVYQSSGKSESKPKCRKKHLDPELRATRYFHFNVNMNHQVVSLRGKFLSEFPANSHTGLQLTLVVSKLKYFLLKQCFKQESNELSTTVPIPAPLYPEPRAFRVRALLLMIPSCVSESSSTQHFIFQV